MLCCLISILEKQLEKVTVPLKRVGGTKCDLLSDFAVESQPTILECYPEKGLGALAPLKRIKSKCCFRLSTHTAERRSGHAGISGRPAGVFNSKLLRSPLGLSSRAGVLDTALALRPAFTSENQE